MLDRSAQPLAAADRIRRLRADAAELGALLLQIRARHTAALGAYPAFVDVVEHLAAALDGMATLEKQIDGGPPASAAPAAIDAGDLADGELVSGALNRGAR